MVQAADRRQVGATSTPPSLPAPAWRRDFSREPEIERLPQGTFAAYALVPRERMEAALDGRDRPAAVMVLAPLLGLVLWGAVLSLLIG
jgi:hypothetical protein